VLKVFQRRSEEIRINTSTLSVPGKSLGTALKKTVYTWVNIIYRGRANTAKAYSSETYQSFFAEEVSKNVDIGDPAA